MGTFLVRKTCPFNRVSALDQWGNVPTSTLLPFRPVHVNLSNVFYPRWREGCVSEDLGLPIIKLFASISNVIWFCAQSASWSQWCHQLRSLSPMASLLRNSCRPFPGYHHRLRPKSSCFRGALDDASHALLCAGKRVAARKLSAYIIVTQLRRSSMPNRP